MHPIPSKVTDLLSADEEVLNAIFRIDTSGTALFVHVNNKFVEFHKNLGVTLEVDDILETTLQDYFRIYLGFTEDQIATRTSSLNQAVKTLKPYPFKEISEHPGVPVLVLDSVWRPVESDNKVFIIWESRVYHQSKF